MDITTERKLEDVLSEPSDADIEALGRVEGDIIILGVSGKMGPSLAARAVRASRASGSSRKIIGVSRFSSPGSREAFERDGVTTITTDLLQADAIDSLPDAPNVIYMAAKKFGTAGAEETTWATNAYLPGLVAQRYHKSRIVAWSSGNVYPLTSAAGFGPNESVPPAPVGEYAQSVLARERIFQYFANHLGTKTALLRLNYAVEPRYGVLVDIAREVYEGRPVDISMRRVNVIWQGDANSICLRSLEHCSSPVFILNVTSSESYSVRWIAERFAKRFGLPLHVAGIESDTALLSDARLSETMFGPPTVHVEQSIEWVANWIAAGGAMLNKPTHFQIRNGQF